MKFIDLTHTFTSDMPVFPGDKAAVLEQVAHIKEDGYNSFRIDTGMHVGTHMDAPGHFKKGGRMIDEIPLSELAGPGNFC